MPGMTLWDARRDAGPFRDNAFNASGTNPAAVECHPPPDDDSMINLLGSGSDFTVFLQRLGVSFLPPPLVLLTADWITGR
jgi:N-acetylated-alpha-linked acidic dipeptidase